MIDLTRSKSENCFRRSIYHNYNPLDSLNAPPIFEMHPLETEVIEDPNNLGAEFTDYYEKSFFNKDFESSPVKDESIRKYVAREIFKVNNKKECSNTKKPSSSRVDSYK